MNNASQDPGHNTPNQKQGQLMITITHPHHPHFGQQFEFVKLRKSKPLTVVVRLPEGNSAYLPVEYTNYPLSSQALGVDIDGGDGNANLLDIEGLLRVVDLIGDIKKRRRRVRSRASSSCEG